jgi:hypothetical protein
MPDPQMPTPEDLAAQNEAGVDGAEGEKVSSEAPDYEGLPNKVKKRLKRQEGMTPEEKQADNEASYRASSSSVAHSKNFRRKTSG